MYACVLVCCLMFVFDFFLFLFLFYFGKMELWNFGKEFGKVILEIENNLDLENYFGNRKI